VVDVVLEEVDEDGSSAGGRCEGRGAAGTADVATVAEALGAVTPPPAVSAVAELADGLVRATAPSSARSSCRSGAGAEVAAA
jgi:hypothetical protein